MNVGVSRSRGLARCCAVLGTVSGHLLLRTERNSSGPTVRSFVKEIVFPIFHNETSKYENKLSYEFQKFSSQFVDIKFAR